MQLKFLLTYYVISLVMSSLVRSSQFVDVPGEFPLSKLPDTSNITCTSYDVTENTDSDLHYIYLCYSKNKVQFDNNTDITCKFGFSIPDAKILASVLIKDVDAVWMPLRREKNTLPYASNAINYFQFDYNSLNISGDFAENNCVVFNQTHLVAVNCSEAYHQACFYDSKILESINKNCNAKYSSSLSIYKNLKECYVLEEDDKKQRNEFCQTTNESFLAEPYDQYEAYTLLYYKTINKPEKCHIGIEYDIETKNFSFSHSTDKVVNYTTYLNIPEEDKKGKFGLIGEKWQFVNNVSNISCAFCQKPLQNITGKFLRIVLKASPITKKVAILIENVYSAFNLEFFCFIGDEFHIRDELKILNSSDNNDQKNVKSYFDMKLYDYPRFYWCESINMTSDFIKSNVLYTYASFSIKIYNALISFIIEPNIYPVPLVPKLNVELNDLTDDDFLKNSSFAKNITFYNESNGNLKVLYQLATNNTLNDDDDLKNVTEILKLLENESVSILKIYNSFFCCKITTSDKVFKNLSWPRTKIGTVTVPDQLCLDDKLFPVSRICNYNRETEEPEWEKVLKQCIDEMKVPQTTKRLFNLLKDKTLSPTEKMKELKQNINKNVIAADINYVAQIFSSISSTGNEDILKDAVSSLAKVMSLNLKILQEAQFFLNSTDSLLHSFDNILRNTSIEKINKIPSNELIKIESVNLKSTNYNLWGLDQAYGIFRKQTRYLNDAINEFLGNDLIVAVYINKKSFRADQWKELNPKLVLTFFIKDALFNEKYGENQNTSLPIVNVLIPDFQQFFREPISILYASNKKNMSCAYWEYGLNDLHQSVYGMWRKSSDFKNDSQVLVCNYTHLTHFAMLVGDESPEESDILTIISIVGCSLSIGGSFIIFVVAMISKKWRNDKSTILLFNFLFSIILTYIIFFISGTVNAGIFCTITAILLHYAILAQFVWTLVFSYFQYNRYVTVFNARSSHAILKSSFISWLTPLIPILITVTVNYTFYHKTDSGLCYLSGFVLKIGVLLPIAIILLLNCLVLLKIIISVSCKHTDTMKKEWRGIMKLIGVMFVFLGINWIFGLILIFDDDNVIMAGLFSLTSTLQGFFVCAIYLGMSSSKIRIRRKFKEKSTTSSTGVGNGEMNK